MRSSYPSRLIPCNRGSRQKKSLASLRVFAVGKFFKIKESATPTLYSVDKGHVQVLDPCKYANRKQCFREQRSGGFNLRTPPPCLKTDHPPRFLGVAGGTYDRPLSGVVRCARCKGGDFSFFSLSWVNLTRRCMGLSSCRSMVEQPRVGHRKVMIV